RSLGPPLSGHTMRALAHSFAANHPNRIVISGYDVHGPDWSVPIDGVNYLIVWTHTHGQEATFRNRTIQPAPMVFLNGIYSRAPGIRLEVQRLSRTCHVLIAERELPTREMARFDG